jgi:nucleoside-diphosphate-sugar epimerase
MKILVTGAAGQVGTDFLPLLLAAGHEPTVFDVAPRPPSCPEGVEWVRGDIGLAPDVTSRRSSPRAARRCRTRRGA